MNKLFQYKSMAYKKIQMQLKSSLLVLVIINALSACSLMPDFVRPKSDMPEQYNFTIDAQQSQQLTGDWWQMYQDEQLNRLVTKAMQHNPNVAMAVANIEQADAYMREVGAALLPDISLQSSALKSRITERGPIPLFGGMEPKRTTFNLRLGSTFELDFWGKLRAAKESAKAAAMASRFAKETVVWSLQSLVVNHYLLYLSLHSQIVITERNIQIRQESLALTQRRFEGGVVSALDVHQATTAYTNLQAQLADLKRLQEIVRNQLALLTGDMRLSLDVEKQVKLPLTPIPPAGIPSRLMDNRPDIRQVEQEMVAANANMAVAKSALYPSISLTTYYGGESLLLSDLFVPPARVWGVGLGLNLPIFNGGRLQSRVDQASAMQKQLIAKYEAVLQKAFQEVNDALVNLRQQTERESALAASLAAAEKALEIANNRYQSGYSAYIDVLDAQRVLNEANLSYVQSQQARLEASVNLFKALGGSWQSRGM